MLANNILRKVSTVSSIGHKHYDVVIAGGGMVGITLALSLGKNNHFKNKKILVLEGASKFKRNNIEKYSNRVSALNRQSVDLLKFLNAWDFIKSCRCKSVNRMEIWGINGERINFEHLGRMKGEGVAFIVENDLILESLYNIINDYKNIEIVNQSGVSRCNFISKPNSLVNTVITKNDEQVTCDLLIGADGFNSTVRKLMNVNTFNMSYNQMAVVATLKFAPKSLHHDVAFQRFIPTGPIALLPLSENECSLVWTTNVKNARNLVSMENSQFVNAINEAFNKNIDSNNTSIVRSFLQTLLKTTKQGVYLSPPMIVDVQEKSRAMFPLGFSHASSYVRDGVLLIGDAAHRIHPLAGLGVNLGFGDVINVTRNLCEALYNGSEINDMRYLLKYEKDCLNINVPIMLGVHAIQQMYSNESFPSVFLRSFGLTIANLSPLKDVFMRRANA